MTVYIELVIIDNFFITYLTAILSYRAIGLSVSRIRAVGAAVTGTVMAVFYPFLNWNAAWILCLKIVLCAVLTLILYLKKGSLIKGGAAFLFTTFLFGGTMFAAGLIVHGSVDKALTLPLGNVPTGLIIAVALLLYVAARRIFMRLKRINDASVYVVSAEIDALDKTFSGPAFLDTGNRLYDEETGLPVVVLNIKAALTLVGAEGLKALVEKNSSAIHKSAHYIEYTGVSGKKSDMLVLKPVEIRLYSGKVEHRIKEVMIGLSYAQFSDSVDYDIILHPAIITYIPPPYRRG